MGCNIAAWALFTAGAVCSLILIEKTSERFGFLYLGLAALTVCMGVGLFALGRGLGGLFGAALFAVGLVIVVVGVVGASWAVGRILSGRPVTRADSRWAKMVRQKPGFTIAELVAVVLAGIEVVLGAVVLL